MTSPLEDEIFGLMLLRRFQEQIHRHCQHVLAAYGEMQYALQQQVHPQFWYAVQNFLTAAANIQKALWGQGGKLAVQREPLRQILHVDESSPLTNTNMRNHFEHFDERLDRWAARSKNHNRVDGFIGPLQPEAVVGGEGISHDIDVFRHYNTETQEIIFWGESFNVAAIVEEVQRILPIAEAEAAKPHWLT